MSYPYEFVEFYERLSFRDTFGLEARLDSYRRLRVLQDGVSSFQERLWGDGDQLFDYSSSLSPVAIALNGTTLLRQELPRPLRPGDELEVRAIRHLHHAFKDTSEWWEFKGQLPHHRVHIAINFPLSRAPDQLTVLTDSTTRRPTAQRPGTHELAVSILDPLPGATYRADWTW